MLNKHSDSLNRVNELVKKHGEKGLTLLFIFKTLKKETFQELETRYPEVNWEKYKSTINQECIRISKDILLMNRETPTKEDIENTLKRIIKKNKDNQFR